MKKRTRVPIQLKFADVAELRERLLKKQGGLCLICQNPASSPVLDHHHVKRIKGSGMVRGVLCSMCNVLLAKVENNSVRYCISAEQLPDVLRNMADYLERPHIPLIHPTEAPKKKRLKKASYNQLIRTLGPGFSERHPYPKKGYLTKPLERLFSRCGLIPEFYK